MRKSVLSLLLVLALAFGAFALVGCAAEEPATEPEAETETEPVEPLPAGVQAIKDAGELRVGVKADVPNFGLQDAATGEFAGMEIDLAYALAERIGLTKEDVKFEAVTAKTRGPLLDNGQIDVVIATFTIKPERLEQWNFTDPYYQDEVGLLVKKDSGIKALKDLNGKKVGEGKIAKQVPFIFSATETLDIGMDLGASVSGVYHNERPFPFTGKIEKVTFELK